MHIDTEIEALDTEIATLDDYDRFTRTVAGDWTELQCHLTRGRGQLVARQAVLFAIKEGF